MDTIRRHPDEGARLIGPLSAWLGEWAGAVPHHHERFDGRGYPRGLAGNEISLAGRIVAVADSYEVMTAVRPYPQADRGVGCPAGARQMLGSPVRSHGRSRVSEHLGGAALACGRAWIVDRPAAADRLG